MWRSRPVLGLLLALGPGLRGQAPDSATWVPDPSAWRLELQGELGGWGSPNGELRLRVVAPGDPRPRREPGQAGWEFWQAERQREEAAFRRLAEAQLRQDPEADERAHQLLRLSWSRESRDPGPPDFAAWACVLRAKRKAQEELDRVRAARQVDLVVWVNGLKTVEQVEVNGDGYLNLSGRRGENRLEVLEPRSGQRLVRTWWQESVPPRLQAWLEGTAPGGYGLGGLILIEPDGRLSPPDSSLSRRAPKAGTYTLRWQRPVQRRWWWDDEPFLGNAAIRLRAQVLLDAGTDRERRWTFEALGLPGAGPLTLGSFDVESD